MQQLSDLEFNLCHVFTQLSKVGVDPADVHDRPKRHTLPGSSEGVGASGPALTLAQLRHVFSFLQPNVPMSDHELEEVMDMIDEDQDGKVTQMDFMHALKVTQTTAFDSRFALTLPWSALDAPTKDHVLTEDDFRAAREGLGPLWSAANDSETHAIIRAMQQAGNQTERMGGSGESALYSSSTPSTRKMTRGVDKESFRRVVSALATAAPDVQPSFGTAVGSERGGPSARSPPPSHAASPAHSYPHAPLHPSSYLDDAPPSLSINVSSAFPATASAAAAAASSTSVNSPSSLPPSMFAESDQEIRTSPTKPLGAKPPALALHSPSANMSASAAGSASASLSSAHALPHPPHTARPAALRKPGVGSGSGSQTMTHRASRRQSNQPLSGGPSGSGSGRFKHAGIGI